MGQAVFWGWKEEYTHPKGWGTNNQYQYFILRAAERRPYGIGLMESIDCFVASPEANLLAMTD